MEDAEVASTTLWLIASVVGAAACDDANAVYQFAVFGDNPYGTENISAAEALIADINRHPDLAWVIHLGDAKGGADLCTDEVLAGRFELFQGLNPPFLFTPGDNDWYDCSMDRQGAFDPDERLAFLRTLFFPQPGVTTGGNPVEVETQRFAVRLELAHRIFGPPSAPEGEALPAAAVETEEVSAAAASPRPPSICMVCATISVV